MSQILQWVLGGGLFAMVGSIVTAVIQNRSSKQTNLREREAATERRFMEENARAVARAEAAESNEKEARQEAREAREEARLARIDRRRAEELAALYRRTLIEHKIAIPELPRAAHHEG